MSSQLDLELRVEGACLEAMELPGRVDRPPIVLLHEGLGSVGLWRMFPHAVNEATSRRVIAFSRYGHGRSDPPPSPRTSSFFHEEACAVLPSVLRQLGVEEPVFVGHSDGASIALIHAAVFPVSGLVLVAPHVVVEDVTLGAIREARERFENGDLRERLSRHHSDPEAAFYGWCDVWLDPTFRSWSLDDDVERVECPILLVQGADDPYGSLDQLDRIEAHTRGRVRRLIVPGGHSPHLDEQETVVRELARFVDELGDGGERAQG
jgi:pimeloyl-ACP methyl ester carboxylesterase